jgi:uncharacterized protein (DUF1778 family)
VARSSIRGGGRRERGETPRPHSLRVRLSDVEKQALEEAAGRSGLALGAFVVQAGLNEAEHRAAPVGALQREAVGELIRAAGLVRRIGVNLNQAVTRLNATGEAGPDLAPAAAYCMRAVRRVDEAAQFVCRGLR